MFTFIIIPICYFWFWIYNKNISNVGISAWKAAGIRNRDERELKNSCMWRISFSFYICLVQYRKFLLKNKLRVGVVVSKNEFWLFELVARALFKTFSSQNFRIKYSPRRMKLYSTAQHNMIWHDNSNIDFIWNISKIMAFTLIAKVSFIDSKSLLLLFFLHNRKNFNYS